MGKHGKTNRQRTRHVREENEAEEEEGEQELDHGGIDLAHLSQVNEPRQGNEPPPSKFKLYQQSVQSPRGDISYLEKFFLLYVGGRMPLHLQEDFCGTAFLSTAWIRDDPRRTAIGVDLDAEALGWCLGNNMDKLGDDGNDRISLFHGNILKPLDENPKFEHRLTCHARNTSVLHSTSSNESAVAEITENRTSDQPEMKPQIPPRDIICAFNYSCCCLHSRSDLITYFRHAVMGLSRNGGIFVMDLYGGASSERPLKLQRRCSDFMYTWEQTEFNIINRMTKISLHFFMPSNKLHFRNAFSYDWRLWSLPEVKDCLLEAGFSSVHFWVREMPDTEGMAKATEYDVDWDVKYNEVSSFTQRDAWNAYIVGVVKRGTAV